MGFGHWFRHAFHSVTKVVTAPVRLGEKLVKSVIKLPGKAIHASERTAKAALHIVGGAVKEVGKVASGVERLGGKVLKAGTGLIKSTFSFGRILIIGVGIVAVVLIMNARGVGQAAGQIRQAIGPIP